MSGIVSGSISLNGGVVKEMDADPAFRQAGYQSLLLAERRICWERGVNELLAKHETK